MKGYLTNNGHAIPLDDEMPHVPYDWCECSPEIWMLNGQEIWVHNAADQRYLVDQAEAIKVCTSFDMFQEQKNHYDINKTKIYPFTDRSFFNFPHFTDRK